MSCIKTGVLRCFVNNDTYKAKVITFPFDITDYEFLVQFRKDVIGVNENPVAFEWSTQAGDITIIDALEGKTVERVTYCDGNGVLGITHTGDTLETVLFSVPYKGGVYQVKDMLEVLFDINKPNITTKNVTYRMRIGVNGTTADNLLATFITNHRSFAFSRFNMQFLTGNLIRTIFNIAGSQTDLNATSVRSLVSVNPANDFWISLTAQLTDSTEKVQCTGVKTKQTKPTI